MFGDIHGQFTDLMRFFDLWGYPTEDGDIESYDYLFLGDYVDRGAHQLETILFLMALKVKFPEKIHMLRGNHEDRLINKTFGFSHQCLQKLKENPEAYNSVFNKINDCFDWLPLVAVIDDQIICVHGGIGGSFNHLSDILKIKRPLHIEHQVCNLEQ